MSNPPPVEAGLLRLTRKSMAFASTGTADNHSPCGLIQRSRAEPSTMLLQGKVYLHILLTDRPSQVLGDSEEQRSAVPPSDLEEPEMS